jgi:hypothetical protein
MLRSMVPEVPGDRLEPQEQTAAFQAWLPQEVELHIAVKRESDRWFALQMEFDITGMGTTRAEAIQDSFALLIAYLHDYYEEDAQFSDTVRPVPTRLRARIIVESAIGRILRRIALHLPLADESTYALPPGLLPRVA